MPIVETGSSTELYTGAIADGDLVKRVGAALVGIPTTQIKLSELGSPDASVQFSQQQALQFRIENVTSDPTTPAVGEIWLRTDL